MSHTARVIAAKDVTAGMRVITLPAREVTRASRGPDNPVTGAPGSVHLEFMGADEGPIYEGLWPDDYVVVVEEPKPGEAPGAFWFPK